MKRVCKGSVPEALQKYALTNPNAKWEEMRNDNEHCGYQAAHECLDQAIRDQFGLCAYCEQTISFAGNIHRRIEHFHPKSDKIGIHNWSLDWENMLAVCDGGSNSSQEERLTHALSKNKSCDAYKNDMMQNKKLPKACEGHLLNPLIVPVFPNLFALEKDTGYFKSNEVSCAIVQIPGNKCESTAALVKQTIDALNLNCDRLAEKRKLLVIDIDRNKKRLRIKGILPGEMPKKLVTRYFRVKWPAFFTALRCCLGSAAEDYLKSIDYQG